MPIKDCQSSFAPTRDTESRFSIHSRFWRLALVCLAAITLGQSTGCRIPKYAAPEAVLLSYRDYVWAKRAFNLRFGNCDRPYSDHFSSGFCEGYVNTCNGGDGYVPALPPEDYRGVEYQSDDGSKCVNAWFEGYPAGVKAARKEGIDKHNNVMISRMINSAVVQANAKNVLPQDVPVVGSKPNGSDVTPPAPPQIDATSRIFPKFSSDSPKLPPIVTADKSKQSIPNTPLPVSIKPASWVPAR